MKIVHFNIGMLLLLVGTLAGCDRNPSVPKTADEPSIAKPVSLRGVSGYTPYDWCSLLWAQSGGEMVWVNSGSEAGKLLVSKADASRRPDWAFCSQGVVAGLSARGERPVVLATLYVSSNAVRPVFRNPRPPLVGSRSMFIPRSSIELAFDRLLQREGLKPGDIRLPHIENPNFASIVSLLAKPASEADALDFGILVEPFITNLINEHPGQYELGDGGIYDLCYCLVARQDDVVSKRKEFVELLRQFEKASKQVQSIQDDNAFHESIWGRKKDGIPERLPKLITFDRRPARLELNESTVRKLLDEELNVLVSKYPDDLKMPADTHALVDSSLLREACPHLFVK